MLCIGQGGQGGQRGGAACDEGHARACKAVLCSKDSPAEPFLFRSQACSRGKQPSFRMNSNQRILRVIKIMRILKIIRILKDAKVVE